MPDKVLLSLFAFAELSNLFNRDEKTFAVGDTIVSNDVRMGSQHSTVRVMQEHHGQQVVLACALQGAARSWRPATNNKTAPPLLAAGDQRHGELRPEVPTQRLLRDLCLLRRLSGASAERSCPAGSDGQLPLPRLRRMRAASSPSSSVFYIMCRGAHPACHVLLPLTRSCSVSGMMCGAGATVPVGEPAVLCGLPVGLARPARRLFVA